MGLTELSNEWYQLTIRSHNCPCVCLQSTCWPLSNHRPALLLLFSSVCPVWPECITNSLLFCRMQNKVVYRKKEKRNAWPNRVFAFLSPWKYWRMICQRAGSRDMASCNSRRGSSWDRSWQDSLVNRGGRRNVWVRGSFKKRGHIYKMSRNVFRLTCKALGKHINSLINSYIVYLV